MILKGKTKGKVRRENNIVFYRVLYLVFKTFTLLCAQNRKTRDYFGQGVFYEHWQR